MAKAHNYSSVPLGFLSHFVGTKHNLGLILLTDTIRVEFKYTKQLLVLNFTS